MARLMRKQVSRWAGHGADLERTDWTGDKDRAYTEHQRTAGCGARKLTVMFIHCHTVFMQDDHAQPDAVPRVRFRYGGCFLLFLTVPHGTVLWPLSKLASREMGYTVLNCPVVFVGQGRAGQGVWPGGTPAGITGKGKMFLCLWAARGWLTGYGRSPRQDLFTYLRAGRAAGKGSLGTLGASSEASEETF
ncbi:unnamed protein product [Calypogeia fissa]